MLDDPRRYIPVRHRSRALQVFDLACLLAICAVLVATAVGGFLVMMKLLVLLAKALAEHRDVQPSEANIMLGAAVGRVTEWGHAWYGHSWMGWGDLVHIAIVTAGAITAALPRPKSRHTST